MHYASIENISKTFGVRTLFKNITLNVEEGDKIANNTILVINIKRDDKTGIWTYNAFVTLEKKSHKIIATYY